MSTQLSSKLQNWFQRSLWLTLSAIVVAGIIIGAVLMASVLLGVVALVLLVAAVGALFGRGRHKGGVSYRFEREPARHNQVLEGDYTVVTRERKNASLEPGKPPSTNN
jgi:uncharacterized protein (DUF58 family)